MIDCSGQRYDGELLHMLACDKWHGKFGHLNVMIRDHDSHVTGFGKHDRVVVFGPEGNTFTARVDHKWELGCPTDAQVMKVARKDWTLRGRWVVVSREMTEDGKSTFLEFKKQ